MSQNPIRLDALAAGAKPEQIADQLQGESLEESPVWGEAYAASGGKSPAPSPPPPAIS